MIVPSRFSKILQTLVYGGVLKHLDMFIIYCMNTNTGVEKTSCLHGLSTIIALKKEFFDAVNHDIFHGYTYKRFNNY